MHHLRPHAHFDADLIDLFFDQIDEIEQIRVVWAEESMAVAS